YDGATGSTILWSGGPHPATTRTWALGPPPADTTKVVPLNADGVKGNAPSTHASISGDGNRIAFESAATNLNPIDPDPRSDIYVKDLTTGQLLLATTSDAGVKSDGENFHPSISAHGTKVAFASTAVNL